MNLIGNAIKFTPSGEIFLEVKAVTPFDGKSQNGIISFSVSDTGVGIPKNKLDEIFFSFSQVDASDTRKYGGTGLGLSISKSIVEALDGEMIVESQEAKGSKFVFNIPIEMKKPFREKLIEEETILLLSSSKKLADIFRKYLTAMGVTCKEFSSLEAICSHALSQSKNDNISVLIDSIFLLGDDVQSDKICSLLSQSDIYLCVFGPRFGQMYYKESSLDTAESISHPSRSHPKP